MWFKLTSKEYDEVIKRLSTCEARLNSLELENETLRNKVLRKIQLKRDEITQEQPQNLNSPMFPRAI